jgi:hypothetical protein
MKRFDENEKKNLNTSSKTTTQPRKNAKNSLTAIVREIKQLLESQKILPSPVAEVSISSPCPRSTKQI